MEEGHSMKERPLKENLRTRQTRSRWKTDEY